MLVLNDKLLNIQVMSLQSGTSLGQTTQMIIDPRGLKIIAFYIQGPHIQSASVLHTSDIRELGPLGFIVDSADSVMELDENLIRLNEVINFNFSLIDKPVVDDSKKKLGRVSEFAVSVDNFQVIKIHVAQSLIKNFANNGLIIHRSQIIRVTDHEIVVRSAKIAKQPSLTEAINPFRKQTQLAPDQSWLLEE